MDWRKTIPGLDGFAELSSFVDAVVCLQYSFRVRIGIVCHVSVFYKFFNFIENIVNLGDRVIVNFSHSLLKIVELAW